MKKKPNPCTEMFAAKGAAEIYTTLVTRLQTRVGPRLAIEDPKQTCVHIIAGPAGTAYAGLHPRKAALLLNIRLQSPLKSKRIRKTEQVSRNRCHCELLLTAPTDIDNELLTWLETAAQLVAPTD